LIGKICRQVEETIESGMLKDLNVAADLLVRSIRSRTARNGASELIHAIDLLSPPGRKKYGAKHGITTSSSVAFEPSTIPQPAIPVGDGEGEDMNDASRNDPEAMMAPQVRDAIAELGDCWAMAIPEGQIPTNYCPPDLLEFQARFLHKYRYPKLSNFFGLTVTPATF
jgi:hypothetical protein